jgi:glycosyltransferase involved in cell wall biosynthesis
MKILFLDQFSELGGAQRCLADLLPAVLERGWTARVALPGRGPFVDLLERMGIEVDFLRSGPYTSGRKSVADALRFARDIRAQHQTLLDLIAQHRPDLLYVNGPRLLPATTHASGALPLIFHSHSYLSKWHDVLLTGRQLRKRNLQVIASSHFVARPLLRYVEPARLRVIYNGTPEIPFRSRPFSSQGIWRIGVIGRIAPEKGQLEFVRAAYILQANGLHAEYFVHGASVLASPAYFESVRAASAGLPIHLTGWHDSVASIMSELELLVVPSPSYESTPRVILEAFSAGTPVIAFASGGIPELFHHRETGFLVPVVTAEALAAAIRSATEDPHTLASITIRARRKWEEEYTLTQYRRQVLDVMEEAVRPISNRNSSADRRTTAAATPSTGP